MKQYRYKSYLFLYYSIVLFMEGLLLNIVTFVEQGFPILLSIMGIVTFISIVFFGLQYLVRYQINENDITVTRRDRVIAVVPFHEVTLVRKHKRNIALTYRYQGKRKTCYINSFLQEYDEFCELVMSKLQERKDYDDIVIFE